jgi:hypothetical protein
MKMDAEIVIIDIDYGVGVLRLRENKHPLSEDWRDFLGVNPISMLEFRHISQNREDLHRLVSLSEFRSWLDEEQDQ